MSDTRAAILHTDGASQGNPGPAAFAYVLEQTGQPPLEVKGCLGITTNNVAEYEALVRGLEHARRLGVERLQVYSDSELLVRQMNGEYQVKNPGLRPLFERAQALVRQFAQVTIRHVPREQNKRADALCREALKNLPFANADLLVLTELQMPQSPEAEPGASASCPLPSGKSPATACGAEQKPVLPADTWAAVQTQALACLRAAAAAWAQGNPQKPAPEEVWAQLQALLTAALGKPADLPSQKAGG
jgi:ribonuclease HI